MTIATTLDCGHEVSSHYPITNGYATLEDGRKVCYDCADANHRATMAEVDTYAGYLSSDGKAVTSWTGGILVRCESWRSAHNMGGTITHWTGTDATGQRWYGKGAGRGMITRMHKSKARAGK